MSVIVDATVPPAAPSMLQQPPGPGALPRFSTTAIANPGALPLLLALLRRAAPEDQLWGLAAFRELLLQVGRAALGRALPLGAEAGCHARSAVGRPWITAHGFHRLPAAPLLRLQGARNLAAADAAGLNRLLIEWLQSTVAAPAGSAGSGSPGDGGEQSVPQDGPSGPWARTASASMVEAAQQLEAPQEQLLQQQLLALLRLSASYSIAAADLRLLLQLLRPGADGRPPPHAPALLEALTSMAAHEGPACFFDCGAESAAPASSRGQQQQAAHALPSGIVCSASLGGGSGAPGTRFVSLPRGGYSFSAWVRLEDGREAAEQLRPPAPAASAQHAPEHAAAAAAAAAASDQALYALLHQQQPSGSHSFLHAHHQPSQLLQGLALAVRRLPPPPGSGGAGSLQLVAHSWSPKHAEAALALQQPLASGRWHHVSVTHSAGGALSHPTLHLYLDGQLQVGVRHLAMWSEAVRLRVQPVVQASVRPPCADAVTPHPFHPTCTGHRPPQVPVPARAAELRVRGLRRAAAPAARPAGRRPLL